MKPLWAGGRSREVAAGILPAVEPWRPARRIEGLTLLVRPQFS